jgi:hypothetical protein
MKSILVVAFVVWSIASGTARGELVHGFLTIESSYEWSGCLILNCATAPDFSGHSVVPWDSTAADLCMFSFVDCTGPYLQGLGGARLAAYDLPLDEVTTARETGASYVLLKQTQSYTMRTRDGFYVKFDMRSGPIEYYIQTDGSTNVDSTVPTRVTTWGRIKALYE